MLKALQHRETLSSGLNSRVQGEPSLRVWKAFTRLTRLFLLAESALLNRNEKSEARVELPAMVAY